MVIKSKFSEMTKRERVEATMNLCETDRVPVYDLLFNDDIIEYFTGQYPPVGEEGLKLKCKTIASMLDMTRSANRGPQEPKETVDKDGFISVRDRWISLGYKKRPFNDEKGAVKWLQNKVIKMKKAPKYTKEDSKKYIQRFIQIKQYIGDDTVVLHDQNGTGLDQIRYALGLELFSYISIDYPGLISEYLDLYTRNEVDKIHAIANLELSPCALTYGDIAHKTGLMHSPDWLKKEFLPRIQKLNDAWHEHGIKCLFHSDGNIMEIMDDLVETGIDGLNPIETVAGMDLEVLKAKYGKKLFFAGGIDMSQLLSTASPVEVFEVCKKAIEITSPGYFIGSTTEIDNSAKLENILAMLEAVGFE